MRGGRSTSTLETGQNQTTLPTDFEKRTRGHSCLVYRPQNRSQLPTKLDFEIRGHSRLVAVATCLKARKFSPLRIASQALNARIPHMLPIGDF